MARETSTSTPHLGSTASDMLIHTKFSRFLIIPAPCRAGSRNQQHSKATCAIKAFLEVDGTTTAAMRVKSAFGERAQARVLLASVIK